MKMTRTPKRISKYLVNTRRLSYWSARRLEKFLTGLLNRDDFWREEQEVWMSFETSGDARALLDLLAEKSFEMILTISAGKDYPHYGIYELLGGVHVWKGTLAFHYDKQDLADDRELA